ncbi:MAG: hypothetical protein AAFW97_00915 [Pseudomonadota bacterium]
MIIASVILLTHDLSAGRTSFIFGQIKRPNNPAGFWAVILLYAFATVFAAFVAYKFWLNGTACPIFENCEYSIEIRRVQ